MSSGSWPRSRPRDSQLVYEAIRLAQPGGLGQVEAMDVAAAAPADLLAAMEAARARDLVARQYVTGFAIVFDEVLPWLLAGPGQGWSLADTIVHTQLRLLSRYGDSLIARSAARPSTRRSQRGRPACSQRASRARRPMARRSRIWISGYGAINIGATRERRPI